MVITVLGEKGGSLAIVHGDGTVNVYSVPENAEISITGQRGFGDVALIQTSVSLTAAVTAVTQQLGSDGAQ